MDAFELGKQAALSKDAGGLQQLWHFLTQSKASPYILGAGAAMAAPTLYHYGKNMLLGAPSPGGGLSDYYRFAPETQFGGFDPQTAQWLQGALTAGGMRRRQMQNALDYMDQSLTPGYAQGRQQA